MSIRAANWVVTHNPFELLQFNRQFRSNQSDFSFGWLIELTKFNLVLALIGKLTAYNLQAIQVVVRMQSSLKRNECATFPLEERIRCSDIIRLIRVVWYNLNRSWVMRSVCSRMVFVFNFDCRLLRLTGRQTFDGRPTITNRAIPKSVAHLFRFNRGMVWFCQIGRHHPWQYSVSCHTI